jgi:hypothetical protein
VSCGCGASFAEKFYRLLQVALSLEHYSHVDIELRIRLTISVSLLKLCHHLHRSISLTCLLKANGVVGARLEERGLRIWVWSILCSYILILVGFDLDHLLVGFIIEN